MSGLEWNEGLSVGVDAIDEDHKGLLRLINQLSDAIVENNAEAVIEEIFGELEDYIRQHFSREEKMLAQCDFDDLDEHRKQHRKFIERIPVLKSHLLTAENIEVAKEVCLFLINWLLNHIVVDDMSYAKTLHDNGLSTKKEDNKSWLDKLVDRIGTGIVLSNRVYLSILIPIVGLTLISALVLWDYFHHFSNLRHQSNFTEIISQASSLNHRLQLERRLSLGQLEVSDRPLSGDIVKIRALTDRRAESLQQASQKSTEKLQINGVKAVNDPRHWLSRLEDQRKAIDDGQTTATSVSQFYSANIDNLMSMFVVFNLPEADVEVIKSISAISSIMHFIELNERLMMRGSRMLRQTEISNQDYLEFNDLVVRQEMYLKTYQSVASRLNRQGLELPSSYINYQKAKQLVIQVQQAFLEERFPDIESNRWHGPALAGLEQLYAIVGHLLDYTNAEIDKRVEEFENTFVIIAVFLLAPLILAYLASWLLSQSIITPVRRFTVAMKRMSQGHRDVRFTDDFSNDDIGEMFQAYEDCRRKLLQVDILAAVRFERQSASIDQREREKEEYLRLASTDVLTGAMNRRKFFELSEQEIKRASRYQHGLTLMMLDIDHFKMLNDTYGHAVGDLVLKEFYLCCFNSVRATDIVARIGGEEFAILMPETDLERACELAERLCGLVSSHEIEADENTIKITVSIGVSEWSEDVENIADLMSKADKALYRAKNDGRNRAVVG